MYNYFITWGDVFDFPGTTTTNAPDGYKLVELEDHKKQRLEKEREALTVRKKMLLGLLDDVNERFEEIKKDLQVK